MNWKIKGFVAGAFLGMFVLSGINTQAQTFNVSGCTSSGSFALDWTIVKDMQVLNYLFNTRALVCIEENSERVKFKSDAGLVILGENQLRIGSELDPDGRLWPVPWALAHEYAHAMQNARGCPFPEDSRRRELHADFMAGWYLSFRMRYVPQDLVTPIIVAWRNGSFTHGKNWERAVATIAGITANRTVAKSDATLAYNIGLVSVMAFKGKVNE